MGVVIEREFCMPQKYTFEMPAAASILDKYVVGEWADPFAGYNSPATWTNDLDEDSPAKYHMDAIDFCDNVLPGGLDGIIFDPPYSAHQIVVSYKKSGQAEWRNGQVQKLVKDIAGIKVRHGGLAICFGWNSNGFGQRRGFQMEHILLLSHGGAHNDTIVTVERKVQGQLL